MPGVAATTAESAPTLTALKLAMPTTACNRTEGKVFSITVSARSRIALEQGSLPNQSKGSILYFRMKDQLNSLLRSVYR